MFNIKKIKQKYQEIYGSPINKYQSICLDLLKLWQEKPIAEQFKSFLKPEQYIPQHKELVISSGRQQGSSTLLKAIQDSYPSDVIIGVTIKRNTDTHCFLKGATFSLNLLKRVSAGDEEAKKKLVKLVTNKTVLMNMGKRPVHKRITNNMINCLYKAGIASVFWLGQE